MRLLAAVVMLYLVACAALSVWGMGLMVCFVIWQGFNHFHAPNTGVVFAIVAAVAWTRYFVREWWRGCGRGYRH